MLFALYDEERELRKQIEALRKRQDAVICECGCTRREHYHHNWHGYGKCRGCGKCRDFNDPTDDRCEAKSPDWPHDRCVLPASHVKLPGSDGWHGRPGCSWPARR